MPLVSIILPAYKEAPYLRFAVKSVQEQSFSDWELIVVDDGLNLEARFIVEDFVKDDSRIVVISNSENLGIQKSLNRGLAVARGKYIARIDDDDTWVDKDKLKNQVALLKSDSKLVLVGTGAIITDEKGKEITQYSLSKLKDDKEIRNKMLHKNCFAHSSVLFRKSSALQSGGYDERERTRHIEDYDLWLKLGTLGTFANLPVCATSIIQHDASISGKNKVAQFYKTLALVKRYRHSYPDYDTNLYLLFLLTKVCIKVPGYWVYRCLPIKFQNKIFKWYKELW